MKLALCCQIRMENTWKEHGKHKSRVCFLNLFGALPVFGQTYFFLWVTWGSIREPGASSCWLLILSETTGPRSACSFLLQRVTYPLNKASKLRSHLIENMGPLRRHWRINLIQRIEASETRTIGPTMDLLILKSLERCDRSPFYRWFWLILPYFTCY